MPHPPVFVNDDGGSLHRVSIRHFVQQEHLGVMETILKEALSNLHMTVRVRKGVADANVIWFTSTPAFSVWHAAVEI